MFGSDNKNRKYILNAIENAFNVDKIMINL